MGHRTNGTVSAVHFPDKNCSFIPSKQQFMQHGLSFRHQFDHLCFIKPNDRMAEKIEKQAMSIKPTAP